MKIDKPTPFIGTPPAWGKRSDWPEKSFFQCGKCKHKFSGPYNFGPDMPVCPLCGTSKGMTEEMRNPAFAKRFRF